MGGGGWAFWGCWAAGKSSLGAVMAMQGSAAMAEDVCVVDAGTDAEMSVLAGGPPLRLWQDAVDRLALATQRLRGALPGKEQFFLESRKPVGDQSRKLAAVVILSRTEVGAVALEQLRGARASGALYTVVHMRRPAHALGRGPSIFSALTRLVSAGVTVWRLKVPQGLAGLRAAAAQVANILEA